MAEEKKEGLSLNDLGLEDETTPAEKSEQDAKDHKTKPLVESKNVVDSASGNNIEVKKVDIDMSEFKEGPKKAIPRPDNTTFIDQEQKPVKNIPKENLPTEPNDENLTKPDLKAIHSTDPNEGYTTVDISAIAKNPRKTREDPIKKNFQQLHDKMDAGIERTKNELTAPGGRIEEGKRKYVNDRFELLMKRAQKSTNLMKHIKAYQEIMDTDPAFDGADDYEKKAYILLKVAKDKSIGVDDKSFGLAQESIKGNREQAIAKLKKIEKLSHATTDLDSEDQVVFDDDDGIPTVKRSEEKEVQTEIKGDTTAEKKIGVIIKDPEKKELDEDDDLEEDLKVTADVEFDNNDSIPIQAADDLIKLKNDNDEDIDADDEISNEERFNSEIERIYGVSPEKFKSLQNDYLKEAAELLNLNKDKEEELYSNFATANRALSLNEALRIAKRSRPQNLTASWGLQYTGIPIQMTSFSGEELVQFIDDIQTGFDSSRPGSLPTVDQLTSIFGALYEHTVMDNKPTFNNWLRRISANDFSCYLFALYNAIFKDCNYITYRCTKRGCAKLYLQKKQIMDMIKYPNDEVKKDFEALLNHEHVKTKLYRTEPIPINDTFAISFVTPTIYSANFEQSCLPYAYRQQHQSIISMMQTIDKVYLIDKTRNQFLPINFGIVEDDLEKTVKRKVKGLERIMQSFTVDQRALIFSEYQKMAERFNVEEIGYQMPESTCPVCGTVIPARESNAIELLFTRARLSIAVASTQEQS